MKEHIKTFLLQNVINTIESTSGTSVLPDINHEIPKYSKDPPSSTFNPSETTK